MSRIEERYKKRAKAIIINRHLLKNYEYVDADTKVTAYHSWVIEIGKHPSNGESIFQCEDCGAVSHDPHDPCTVHVEHVRCKSILKSGKNKGKKCGNWASPEYGTCGHHWRDDK